MKQNYDQKKGSADQCSTGQKQGLDGGSIGRGNMNMGSQASNSESRSGGSRSDHGGSEGNSRERKSARNGSDSSES